MKVHDVEQNTPEWEALRRGKPTSSSAGLIVTSAGKPSASRGKCAAKLAAELFAGEPVDAFEGNKWTDRGHELEDEAIAHFEMVQEVEVKRIGFVTDDEESCGTSPDGMFGDWLVEVKCLKAENHIEALMYIAKNKKPPVKYIPQIQDQMLVTGAKCVMMIFHHPQLPSKFVAVQPDKAVQDALLEGKKQVIVERDKILKELRKIEAEDESVGIRV